MDDRARPPVKVPAEVRAALESAGASLAEDPATGSVHIALNGFPLVRIDVSPPGVVWDDSATGHALMSLMAYEGLARMLQENRGADTLAMRQVLREQLQVDPLLRWLSASRMSVKSRGGLSKKEYEVGHPAFGTFALLTVFRGQSHVVDVAFSSPRVFVPLRALFDLTMKLRSLETS